MRILTGIKPTGNGMHLGNYLGMLKPLLNKAKETNEEVFLMIADYHSLTSVHDGDIHRLYKKRLASELLAFCEDIPNIYVFEQSKIKYINDFSWILSSVTPYSLMLRAHTFKDSKAKNSDINMATFNYPILMAADILSYDVELVPVGKDQTQHLEFARDIAGNFNAKYGVDFFILPEGYYSQETAIVPGTDGRKMSKSYNNFLGIFDDEKILKKKIMSIVTDDTPLEEPKDYKSCNVYNIAKHVLSDEEKVTLQDNYKTPGYGYGHAKLFLLDHYLKYFNNYRDSFEKFYNNDALVQQKLEAGNKKMNELQEKKYTQLKQIVGL